MADNTDSVQTPAGQPEANVDDFSSAFAERAGRDEKQPEAETPKEDEPAPAAAEPKGDAEPEKAEAQFDPWNGLSDEQKSYFQKLQHSDSSNRGRVASLNRTIEQLRAAGQPPAGQEPGNEEASPKADDDRTAKLKAAAEEYPDAVGPLVEAIVDLQARLEDKTPQAPQEEAAPSDEDMAKEYEALATAHPDYVEIGSDPSYAKWVGSKPKSIQALANSFAAEDVASVLTLYKAERQASMASQEETPGAKTDTTAHKRERQLEGSRAVLPRGAPTASGPAADDFHAAFNARASAKR